MILYARAMTYDKLKRWEEAERDLLRANELSPDQPFLLNYLGYSWIDRGVNLERGKAMIQRAVELKPTDGYIIDSLGWALYRMGDFPGAVTNLERAVELKPLDPPSTIISAMPIGRSAGRPKPASSGAGRFSMRRTTSWRQL